MVGLVRREVAGVDLTPLAVGAGARGRAGPLEKLNDARVRGREPPRKLHRVALVVPPLRGDRVLVVRRDGRPLLIDATLNAIREDLGRVGDVPDDLESGPLVELRTPQAVGRHRSDDPRDGRGVVGQPERLVLVVPESFHVLSSITDVRVAAGEVDDARRLCGETGDVRELAAASLLLLALVVGALAPQVWPDDTSGGAFASGRPAPSGPLATVASTAFAAVAWKGKDGGTGYVVCGSTDSWSRPSIAEQNAHLASDPRYAGMRADEPGSDAWTRFRASALVYDGSTVSARVDLVALTGMWTDPHIGGNAIGCTSAEPQVWLVGYEPVSFRGSPGVAELGVQQAAGYRMVILTGEIGTNLIVFGGAGGKIAAFDTSAFRGHTPKPAPKATPRPTPTNKAPAERSPLVPIFPRTDRPLELALPSICAIETARRHDDDLGMTWRVQCGSATANLTVAPAAIEQGWNLFSGNPPIGVGLQNYSKNDLWMQIAYRLDGPAFADAFVIVQSLRTGIGSYDTTPHEFMLGPMCGVVDPPTRSADGAALKWLARCGGVGKAIVDIDSSNAPLGWKLESIGTDPYATRRYCKLTVETLLRTGSDLGTGVMTITQTEGACR
jgi:hypothetical protein